MDMDWLDSTPIEVNKQISLPQFVLYKTTFRRIKQLYNKTGENECNICVGPIRASSVFANTHTDTRTHLCAPRRTRTCTYIHSLAIPHLT